MNVLQIFELIDKGVAVANALIDAGRSAKPAIVAIGKLSSGAQDGKVTQADMDEVESQLDAMLEEFNQPLPPE